MRQDIPVRLEHRPELEIDGARVARGLGLDTTEFRRLMARGKIAVLCERGTGEDAGLLRASFYYAGRRTRFVIDGRNGMPVRVED
ncbi:DUF6522 family protein [Luteimonas huabeiensis]|uniref:DUF6522 family protein n=1 Tax=Luteimonas huabeiensis TaxID=1244513 RepID=UPI0004648229|nr:DUF6522 family protein [Luteimonas huabeiensis]